MNPNNQGGYGDNSGYSANTQVETWGEEYYDTLYEIHSTGGVTYYEIKEQFKNLGYPPTIVISSENNPTDRNNSAFQCFYCESTSSRKADLERHYNTQHDPEPKMSDCPRHRCSRKGDNGFTRKDHLTEHMRNYHNDNEKYPKRLKKKRENN